VHSLFYEFDFEKIGNSAGVDKSIDLVNVFNYINGSAFINGNISLLRTQKVFDEEEAGFNDKLNLFFIVFISVRKSSVKFYK
jgi:hypothetical protein